MTRAFWHCRDRGGHFARATWRLHRDRGDGVSRCGLVVRSRYSLDQEAHPQGDSRRCRTCYREEVL